MQRYLRIALGGMLLLLGVAGLVLPILQGFLLIAAGIMLLARDVPLFARIASQIRERFPRTSHAAETAKRRIAEWWRSRFGNP